MRAVWENELGGLTFEVGAGLERRLIKWAPAGSGLDLPAEVARLAWAGELTAVPRVLDFGEDQTGTWLVTQAVPGESAVSGRWKSAPGTAVAAIGKGLRVFHDALPVAHCPFTWSAQECLDTARQQAALGLLDPATWHVEHQRLTVEQALDELTTIPPLDHAVV